MKATCHPEKEQYGGNGLCETCYQREWAKRNKEKIAEQRKVRYYARDQETRHKDNVRRYARMHTEPKDGDKRADCHPDRKHYSQGLCNKCYDAQRHKREYANPEFRQRTIKRVRTHYQAHREEIRWQSVFRIFGIRQEQYEAFWKKQNGACAICGGQPRRDVYFTVDHDHKCCKGRKSCGKCVRGLLCLTCNAGLGQFNDNVDLLKKAILYLQGTPP